MHFENTCVCFVCLLVKQTLLIAKAAAYGLGLPRPMELDLGRTVDEHEAQRPSTLKHVLLCAAKALDGGLLGQAYSRARAKWLRNVALGFAGVRE